MANSKITDPFFLYLHNNGIVDLESAKAFMMNWVLEGQPDVDGMGFTTRALAGHVSRVLEILEGATEELMQKQAADWNCSYINTKYGVDLYFAAWG